MLAHIFDRLSISVSAFACVHDCEVLCLACAIKVYMNMDVQHLSIPIC